MFFFCLTQVTCKKIVNATQKDHMAFFKFKNGKFKLNK